MFSTSNPSRRCSIPSQQPTPTNIELPHVDVDHTHRPDIPDRSRTGQAPANLKSKAIRGCSGAASCVDLLGSMLYEHVVVAVVSSDPSLAELLHRRWSHLQEFPGCPAAACVVVGSRSGPNLFDERFRVEG